VSTHLNAYNEQTIIKCFEISISHLHSTLGIVQHFTFRSTELFTASLHLLIDCWLRVFNVPIVDLFYSSGAEIRDGVLTFQIRDTN